MRTIDGILPNDAYTGEIVQRNDDYWVYDDGIWARVPTAAAQRIVSLERRVGRLQDYASVIREELITRYPEIQEIEMRVVQNAYLQSGDLPAEPEEVTT